MPNTIEEFYKIINKILQDLAKTLPKYEPPKFTYIKTEKEQKNEQ